MLILLLILTQCLLMKHCYGFKDQWGCFVAWKSNFQSKQGRISPLPSFGKPQSYVIFCCKFLTAGNTISKVSETQTQQHRGFLLNLTFTRHSGIIFEWFYNSGFYMLSNDRLLSLTANPMKCYWIYIQIAFINLFPFNSFCALFEKVELIEGNNQMLKVFSATSHFLI